MSGADAEEHAGEDPDVRTEIEDRLDRIRLARLRRVLAWVGLVVLIAALFFWALQAIELLGNEWTVWNYLRSLTNFFPVAYYDGIPFLNPVPYVEFIAERNLLFAGDVSLLWSDPLALFGEMWTILNQQGFFALFGVAGNTLAVGFAGTVLGFPLALLFGVLGSERVLPFPLNFVFRGTMSAIRAIPALVWILIYVPLAGITPAAAVLAVGTDTIGNLGRLFTDELEEIDEGPIEAMETTGANRPQTVTFGMLSQVVTPYIAWTLYIFEINVRIAVSLGVLGAGGLGEVVETQLGLYALSNAMATLVCIFLLIISVELFSQRVRSRLRSETETMSLRELIFGFPRRFAESLTR
jgi:phosphonate transport system permease protein